MVELEADHRRHAEIENTIRDLKYGVGLNHLPSGRFGANAAWLAFNVMATIWPAFAPGSDSATRSSGPRPFAAATCQFLDASPTRPVGARFTSRRTGRGRSGSKMPFDSTAPSCLCPEFFGPTWPGLIRCRGQNF
jgi:hypothetical protein